MIFGGNSMKAAGKVIMIISLTIITALFIFAGCSPDRKGTALANQPPQVFMVNTPPDSASFSRNPELNWYATDIDGYIVFFRYAVVRATDLKIDGSPVDVETFVSAATEEEFGWDTLTVDLDHPQSTATIRLYADTVSPVDTYVPQYFFVQAQDDAGAKSDITYRCYTRNNHYPNTHLTNPGYSINAEDTSSPAPGIIVSWDGADSTDYGRVKPPLEYEWRLYGPFSADAIICTTLVCTSVSYNPQTESYDSTWEYAVNLDSLPPALPAAGGGEIEQPLRRSEGTNYKIDPSDVWVSTQNMTIYDVFNGADSTLVAHTSEYQFVFWVRARDDGYLPDPAPAFAIFKVANAKFEKPVAVVDATDYKSGYWSPKPTGSRNSSMIVKTMFYNYINEALDNISPNDSFTINDYPRGSLERDYFHFISQSKDSTYPSVLNMLSHKVIIYFSDGAAGGTQDVDEAIGPSPTLKGLMNYVCQGISMGSSGWFMARNAGGLQYNNNSRTLTKSATFQYYFGISSVTAEGWLYETLMNAIHLPRLPLSWNEEFIGATSIMTSLFPSIDVDTSLLNSRYVSLSEDYYYLISDPDSNIHYLTALPEIGTCSKTAYAAPIYVYNSKFGGNSSWHGKVMGVAQQIDEMKTIAILFTPTGMDSVQTQAMFNSGLAWLMEKFQTSEKKLGVSRNSANSENLAIRREGVKKFLRELNEGAARNPEMGRRMGILPPLHQ